MITVGDRFKVRIDRFTRTWKVVSKMKTGRRNLDCKTVVFFHFRKARSAVSVILACKAREPHTPVGRVPSPFLHSLQTFRWNIYRVSKYDFRLNIYCVSCVRKKYDCFAV